MMEENISTLSEDPNQSPEGFVSPQERGGILGELRESIVGEGRVFRKITGVQLPEVWGQAAWRTESGSKWEAAG